WWLWVRIQLHEFPWQAGSSRIGKPVVGWWRGVLDAASQSWSETIDTAQLGQAAVPLIICVGFALLVAAVYALRLRSVVHPAYLAFGALYACIVAIGVQYPKDLFRELAPLLTLMPFAFLDGASQEQQSAHTHPRARPRGRRRRGS